MAYSYAVLHTIYRSTAAVVWYDNDTTTYLVYTVLINVYYSDINTYPGAWHMRADSLLQLSVPPRHQLFLLSDLVARLSDGLPNRPHRFILHTRTFSTSEAGFLFVRRCSNNTQYIGASFQPRVPECPCPIRRPESPKTNKPRNSSRVFFTLHSHQRTQVDDDCKHPPAGVPSECYGGMFSLRVLR